MESIYLPNDSFINIAIEKIKYLVQFNQVSLVLSQIVNIIKKSNRKRLSDRAYDMRLSDRDTT